MPVYKTKNENFFKKWTPEMAYVLGFFTADGNMLRNKRGAHFVEIQSTDKEIVSKIRKVLKSNLKIGEYQPRNSKHKKRYRLQIGSKEIFKDLIKLGITPNKSKTIELPEIPDDYFSHFVRGYFDGDGCVSIFTYQKKDRTKPSVSIISHFVSGSKRFLEEFYNRLKRRVVEGGTFYFFGGGHRLSFSVHDSKKLYGFMYNNCGNLFLIRKKKIFEKYFKIR